MPIISELTHDCTAPRDITLRILLSSTTYLLKDLMEVATYLYCKYVN